MKLDIIFLVVLGICAVLFFSSSTCSNTEHFDAASDIKAAVNTIYQADVGAIRTLADISSKLTNGQFLTVPGALSINGVTNVNSGVDTDVNTGVDTDVDTCVDTDVDTDIDTDVCADVDTDVDIVVGTFIDIGKIRLGWWVKIPMIVVSGERFPVEK